MIETKVFAISDTRASSNSDAARINIVTASDDFYSRVRERFLRQSAEYLRSTSNAGDNSLN